MLSERVILVPSDDSANESEDDLYKGYNDFNPVLDTRNIQEDDIFRETINQSSYGRGGAGGRTGGGGAGTGGLKGRLNTSTAGVAFSRGTGALKSRPTGRGTGTGLTTAGGGATGTRPLTAVRGAGYTSQGPGGGGGGGGGVFDPLGLANGGGPPGGKAAGGFHLTDENTPEHKIKQLERQINRLLEESVKAAERKDSTSALDLAKDAVAKERSLNRMKEQSGLTEQFGVNSDLTFAGLFNLAEQYSNAKMWPEAVTTYTSILKNRSFTNTGRLRMNLGELHFRQGQYPKAIKFFRMALDQVPGTQNELKLKLMQNIGLSFVRLTQFADAIASFEYIASERGDLDAQTAFHLIVCYYAMGDAEKMKYYFGKLLQVKVEDQFEERYGHHEVLTNGGNIFAGGHQSPMLDRVAPGLGGSGIEMTITGASGRVSSPVLLIRDEHDHHANLLIEAIRNDQLRQYEKEKITHVEWCILTAAKLIAPFIEQSATGSGTNERPVGMIFDSGELSISGGTVGAGYDWCLEQIRHMENVSLTAGFTSNGTSSSANGTLTSSGTGALNYANLADELELYKAVKHLRSRDFEQAIGTLKVFEKKDKLSTAVAVSSATIRPVDGHSIGMRPIASASGSFAAGGAPPPPPTPTPSLQLGSVTPTHGQRLTSSTTGHSRVAATAATNLSFLYLLQQELDIAGRYADEAIAADRYCLGALLNRGNVLYHQADFHRAIDYYREVINTNPNCLEAYFNMALAERKLDNPEKALESLFKLRALTNVPAASAKSPLNLKISNTIGINLLYQIGSIYETMGNLDQAIDFYQQVLNMVPTDVSLLVKMADLASDANDRKQALSYLMESFRYLPSHIPTIERLAAYYIEVKMYEKAIKYLEQLANIQPGQIKWQLMIAASYRRAGNYQAAFTMYQTIHGRFPDNADCLKFLIRICTELEAEGRSGGSQVDSSIKNYAHLAEQYTETLKRLEKSRELREQQALQQQQSSSRSASRASAAAAGRVSSHYGSRNGINGSGGSREGSAATSISSGGSSSGYLTSGNSGKTKSDGPSPMPPQSMNQSYSGGGTGADSRMNRNQISAIVDQVVEQLDSTTLNERPTTSWSRRKYDNSGGGSKSESYMNGGDDADDDLLLDANLDDILPD